MPNVNPYECTQSLPPLSAHRPSNVVRHALAAAPGLAVVAVAATKYVDAARSVDGALAGSILVVVGFVVGRELASEKSSRRIAIFMSGGFAIALCTGWIDHQGGELTLWAFSCMSAGILAAACAPVRDARQLSELVEAELLPMGVDDTKRRN